MADAWEQLVFGNLDRDGKADNDLRGGPDGLRDADEYANSSDPHHSDTDGDGLDDGAEIDQWGTRADDADTDGDGMQDGWEIMHGLQPTDHADGMEDADADGVANYYEFLYNTRPDAADSRPDPTRFVDHSAAPGGDGSAAHPYASIQEGLDAAADGEILYVAAGTYTGERNRALNFWGKAILLDAVGVTIDCENVARGFEFTRGEDQRSVVRGITIRHGSSSEGGAVWCFLGSPTFLGCTFTSNTAFRRGGAISITDEVGPRLIDCTFLHNHANEEGGAAYCWGTTTQFSGCYFEGNTAPGGGALMNEQANPHVERCVFVNNQADVLGGAIYNRFGSRGSYQGCTLQGNRAVDGGAVHNDRSHPLFSACRIQGNSATNRGGAMHAFASDPHMVNCTLAYNAAGQRGGALSAEEARPRLVHCTVAYNRTGEEGGGGLFSLPSFGACEVRNTVLWSNVPNALNPDAVADVQYSAVQDGWPGKGNADADPLLTAALRLQATSPYLDAGDPIVAPLRDADNERRKAVPGSLPDRFIADLGADEFIDRDQDDLADHWERTYFLDLRAVATDDTDKDGLNERQEYIYATDPTRPDTDGDGVNDGTEVAQGTNPRDPTHF